MNQELHTDLWPYILSFLSDNFDLNARNTGAFKRARGVNDPRALLRMFLAYATTNQPLSGVIAWAEAIGIASMSPSAFMYRLENAEQWLSQLISDVLNDVLEAPPGINSYRLRIVDATVINGPGHNSVDWRVHAFVDPLAAKITAIDITDQHKGEGFGIHPLKKHDLVLGDRGYGYARSIFQAKYKDADVLVRLNPLGIRLCDGSKNVVNWSEMEQSVPQVGPIEFSLLLPEPPPKKEKGYKNWPLKDAQSWLPVRVIGVRSIKGKVFWILTTAPIELIDPPTILKLYRLRWQIELFFKRLKSLLHIDLLPAKTESVAKPWLLVKLLAAVLVERLAYENRIFSPWGYRIRNA